MSYDSEITVITCSGISNTGKLTAKVGEILIQRCPGQIEVCLPARAEANKMKDALIHADHILVVDGCNDCCGRKKLREHGYEPDIHIIATECGIVKNGMEDPRFDEIELLTSVIREKIR
ncbi:MAG TPA: putative zinc-binding protein [Methanospirillum sp.]|mgnify:FL=1|uniref:putative zinc-binding protein n=1 Tax=Methanospirillum sp. TaxID=45200 RepID=UPI002D007117|nr:putative zinc-binding protein [Methanospirillum sp.]HOJ95376.1 putative zinc-binding protein [Methanospirillum sp.]HOL41574.1 putative zinc-binding protein [Methanospirillum sp.]HPP76857.1 putative zinc-binding protein [Methanospirillum sp.]